LNLLGGLDSSYSVQYVGDQSVATALQAAWSQANAAEAQWKTELPVLLGGPVRFSPLPEPGFGAKHPQVSTIIAVGAAAAAVGVVVFASAGVAALAGGLAIGKAVFAGVAAVKALLILKAGTAATGVAGWAIANPMLAAMPFQMLIVTRMQKILGLSVSPPTATPGDPRAMMSQMAGPMAGSIIAMAVLGPLGGVAFGAVHIVLGALGTILLNTLISVSGQYLMKKLPARSQAWVNKNSGKVMLGAFGLPMLSSFGPRLAHLLPAGSHMAPMLMAHPVILSMVVVGILAVALRNTRPVATVIAVARGIFTLFNIQPVLVRLGELSMAAPAFAKAAQMFGAPTAIASSLNPMIATGVGLVLMIGGLALAYHRNSAAGAPTPVPAATALPGGQVLSGIDPKVAEMVPGGVPAPASAESTLVAPAVPNNTHKPEPKSTALRMAA